MVYHLLIYGSSTPLLELDECGLEDGLKLVLNFLFFVIGRTAYGFRP